MRFQFSSIAAACRLAAKIILVASVTIVGAAEANAKKKAPAYNPKSASIVIDAGNGKILHASNADAPRHPASLTKMMTIYMLFDALERGQISKNSKIIFSRHASSMAPSKLGVKAGGSISVEAAILALVTKSANDAAAASAEFLGGSEPRFAQMMTAKARQLGMRNTRFYNASGLPDPRQITTARDMATLGIALREHFPQYYGYFSTRSFAFGRSRLNNHNKLLGRVAGVDGIKTGYTRMSGFNLVSSVSVGKKKMVAVVLGGKSGRSRDAEMAGLISKYLPSVANGKGGTLIAMQQPAKAAPAAPLAKEPDAAKEQVVALVDTPKKIVVPKKRPNAVIASLGPDSTKVKIVPLTEEIEANVAEVDTQTVTASTEPEAVSASADVEKGAWVIQIAAADSENGALKILSGAKSKGGKALVMAEAFTQPVTKGGTTLFRARFAGFQTKDQAWKACEALKRQKYGCFALTN